MSDHEFSSHYRLEALKMAQNRLHLKNNSYTEPSYTVDTLLQDSQRLYEFLMIKNEA